MFYRDYDLDIFGTKMRCTLLSKIARRRSVPLVLIYGIVYLSRLRGRAGLVRRIVESPTLRPEEILQSHGDLSLDGYWQRPRYFEGSVLSLRQEFSVCEPILPASKGVAAMIAETDSICLTG